MPRKRRPGAAATAVALWPTAAAFRQAGWDAYNLAGGLRAWVEHGLELEPVDGEVAESRPGV